MTRTFPMTRDAFHVVIPALLIPILLGQGVFLGWVMAADPHLPAGLVWLLRSVGPGLWVVLTVTALMAPRALVLTAHELVIERFLWPSFHVPLSALVSAEPGPNARLLHGKVRRLAGNGGWFWSGGLFRAEGVGNVRAWLTRLGPTVVLHRKDGLPLLVSADDTDGFLRALKGITARRGWPTRPT